MDISSSTLNNLAKRLWKEDVSPTVLRTALHDAAETIDRLQANSRLAIATEKGEVWFWQGDGYDYPDTLVCPVVVQPDVLRALIRASEELEEIKSVK